MDLDYKKIVSEVLSIEAEALLDCAARVDDSISQAVELIYSCRGKLIVTGVGKSGLIGAKMAATLASTGTASFFLHPTEALHGDLGMIGKDDIVLAISYSGESSELSAILPHIKRFDIPLIGMTKNRPSTLSNFCDVLIDTTIKKEACPFGVAPTSSTTLSLALGDALAVSLMRKRNFKKEDFASLHPGGSLGRQLFIKVSDIMRTKDLPIVDEQTPISEAIVMMSQGRIGAVIVCKADGRLSGVFTDGDLRRALIGDKFDINLAIDRYSNHNPKTIKTENMLASDALILMEHSKIQILIAVDNQDRVLGVLHLHDLVEHGIKS